MMLEIIIEEYLVARVKQEGGEIRKAKWVARAHCPDRYVMLNGGWWVELKAPGEVPRPGQVREHARMRERGVGVHTLDTREKVDQFIEHILQVPTV